MRLVIQVILLFQLLPGWYFSHFQDYGHTYRDLQVGDTVILEYSSGNQIEYIVKDVRVYQAVTLWHFRDMETGYLYGEYELADMLLEYQLILQTCLDDTGWGRIFILCDRKVQRPPHD